jgi:UDP-N-acetyl-D-mannosaminuronic acid dehydrogenase
MTSRSPSGYRSHGSSIPEGEQGDLVSRIRKKDAEIGVVGLGQVGLPTALSFVKGGFNVTGYDTNSALVNSLSQGITMITENDIKDLLVRAISDKKILFSSSSRSLINSDVVVICVPTPLGTNLEPDLSYLTKAITEIGSCCIKSKKKLIIIESSIPPTTMSVLVSSKLERITGKICGVGFLLAFCPERLSPGQALREISHAVRLIGVSNDESFESAEALYSCLTNAELIKTNFETAEISKLAENAFRDVNIAFANELAMICRDYQADVKEVINIANTHPRVNILDPGPGVGGPCLPKDPYLLTYKSSISSSLIRRARSINDSIPAYLVGLLASRIHTRFSDRAKNKIKIGILGVTYKPNVNDYQNSPTERIIFELSKHGYQDISVHDPICKETFGMKSNSDLKSLLKDGDCIIICTGHEVYASLSPGDFKPNCIILDAARLLNKEVFITSGHVHYMAPGLDY